MALVKQYLACPYCPKGAWPPVPEDGPIVAWHEVPGTARPQKSRPVGYGLIRACTRTDSTIGVISLP
jgi:hypothetical protein